MAIVRKILNGDENTAWGELHKLASVRACERANVDMQDPSGATTLSSPPFAEFMALCAPCQRSLFGYIVMMVGNTTAAHDILQDTNLILWQKFDQFQPGTNFFAFAREIARYRVLRYQQFQAHDAVLLEPKAMELLNEVAVSDDPMPENAYHEALAACIGKLHESDAELIRSRYEPGFSVQMTAKRMGRSENAVSQSLARIRRILRQCIERNLRSQGLDFAS